MSVDAKRLARLAREPTRVFGFTEVCTYRWPVVRVMAEGDEWWGPGHGPWLFRQLDEPDAILARAVDKLGFTRANGSHTTAIEHLLGVESEDVTLDEPVLVELGQKHLIIGHPTEPGILPAVAVAYTEKRYGPGHWQRLVELPVFRYHTEGGITTALVCALDRKVEVPGGEDTSLE